MKEIIIPIEFIIHQALHDIAVKYEIDIRLVTEIIKEYDRLVSPRLITSRFNLLISLN